MTQKNILIIDDDKNDVALFSAWLIGEESTSYQFHIFSADNASSGLEIAEKEDIDCIMVDYKMAGPTGLYFLKLAEKLPKSPPIMLLTAFPDEAVELNSIEGGAQFFLKKSELNADELRHRVTEAIELHQHGLLENYHSVQKKLVRMKYNKNHLADKTA